MFFEIQADMKVDFKMHQDPPFISTATDHCS